MKRSTGALFSANVHDVNLFVSYAHSDATWFERLRPLLRIRVRTQALHSWHDQALEPGNKWHDEISRELDRMDVFVCLVSYAFLASDYIFHTELTRAQERYEEGEVEVLPILIGDMDLQLDCPFLHHLNPLPAWNRPWCKHARYDDALKPIGDGLKNVVDRIRGKRERAVS